MPARIKVLRQRKADLVAEAAALKDKALEENRDLTEEERATSKELLAKIGRVNEDIADEEALMDAERELDGTERGAAPAAEEQERRTARIEVRDRAEQDPKRGFRDHKDYLTAVMSAGRNPSRMDTRLAPLQAQQGSDEQGVYSDPHGGFLVPHGVAPGILSIEAEHDFIAPLVTDISPMTAPTVSFNARVDRDHTSSVSGGFVVTRRPETVDGTSSRQKFEQVTLTANEEFGLCHATERILHDSPQSFVALIGAGFQDEYANNAIKERLRGSGVGERLGILHENNGCLVTIAKETNQAADTIVTENIDKMAAQCWRYANAIWVANHDTRPQLRALVRAIGTGGSVVSYFTTEGGREMLDGRPIYFTEHASTLGDKGDLVLCNWSQYLEGTYQQLQTAESIHVRFLSAERTFRFYRRNDGQPWWRTPLQPAQSAKKLSPFVTLAARA